MKLWRTTRNPHRKGIPSFGGCFASALPLPASPLQCLAPFCLRSCNDGSLKDSQAGLLFSSQFLGCFAGSALVTRHLRRALLLGASALATGWVAFALALSSLRGLWFAPAALLIAGLERAT